ncbi:hypothetical protein ACFW7J_11690, partial [Streptomyces sp. NPDC059525]
GRLQEWGAPLLPPLPPPDGPPAAVVSVRAPSAAAALRWAADCREEGLSVGCFRPPSVPDGISRLRLTARADLTGDEIVRAVGTVLRTAPAGATEPVQR